MAPQWEVFVRSERDEPLRHVGSVTAATAASAREHATRLFGWNAVDIWCCPADSVERRTTRTGETDLGGATEVDSEPRRTDR